MISVLRHMRVWGLVLGLVAAWSVQAGRAQTSSTIVIPGEASAQRRASAQALQRYIEESTGARIPITTRPGGGLALHVGRSAYVDSVGLRLNELGADGFVLKLVDQRNFVIAGPGEWGTEFGVYDFLERCVGVRWLFPGELGTDVPRRRAFGMPAKEVRSEPAFISRKLGAMYDPAHLAWARRNRMRSRIEYSHNLQRLLPPSKYARSNPEFYPMIKGRRHLPRNDQDHRWQPNFAAEGIAAAAVEEIKRYFRLHPDEDSYSLGVNDSLLFDQSAASTRLDQGKNILGQRNVSNSYYRWCNEVVAGVTATYPDKWFGCLAYNNVIEPPSGFELHPRLIPYLTNDRMQWADARWKKADQSLTERWGAAARQLGWYDYVYGASYCVPRVYPHLMGEYLRWARDHGVRGYTCEVVPFWGEGPKLYVLLKLLWDPEADVDRLLADWYVRCVGEEAAPALREYFEIWERFWTEQAPESAWWPDRRRIYLRFMSPEYLNAVDESDLARSRELLEACVSRAETDVQRARARLFLEAFAYYEASALAYRAGVAVTETTLDSEARALEAIEDAQRRMDLAARRQQLIRQFADHPLLTLPAGGMQRLPQLRGDDWGSGGFWRLYDWARKSPKVRQRLAQVASFDDNPNIQREVRVLLWLVDGLGGCVSKNASFEAELAGWQRWLPGERGTCELSTRLARSGQHSLRCEGLGDGGGPHQVVPIEPGSYVAVLHVFVPGEASRPGVVGVGARLRDAGNRVLQTTMSKVRPRAGEWVAVICPFEVAAEVDGKRVDHVWLVCPAEGFASDVEFFLDDIGLYRRRGV